MILLLLGLGCAEDGGAEPQAEDTTAPEELALPDLSGVDLPAAYEGALRQATAATAAPVWAANLAALDLRHEGCPDLYAGPLEALDIDEDAGGLAWYDHCATEGDLAYEGGIHWQGEIAAAGDPGTAKGQTLEGQRAMTGLGTVSDDGEVLLELKGEAEDSLYQVTADGYERWTYASQVSGTATGSLVPGGGWRSDLYLYATGGDGDSLEIRGNLYLFEGRIAERFDSLAADLAFAGPTGATADTCALEPRGWIGLRDENAWWLDLVFLPLEGDIPEGACDGCGTLYVRGLETTEYGKLCLDFTWLWSEGPLVLPEAADFVSTLRQLEEGD